MEFNGAALYTAEEIKNALYNYNQVMCEYSNILDQAEEKYIEDNKGKRYWRFFIFPRPMTKYEILYEGLSEWETTWYKLIRLGYIGQEVDRDFMFFGKPRYLDLYNSIKNLTNGGKDCYLNPDQAWFVNKYK